MFNGYAEKQLVVRFQQTSIDRTPNFCVVFPDLRNGRPVPRLVLRKIAGCRIDAECKQMVKLTIERRHAVQTCGDQVPVKGLYVSEIKNNAMPLGDWSLVQRPGLKHAENFICAGTRVAQVNLQRSSECFARCNGRHSLSLSGCDFTVAHQS